jgi:hypothetical protein
MIRCGWRRVCLGNDPLGAPAERVSPELLELALEPIALGDGSIAFSLNGREPRLELRVSALEVDRSGESPTELLGGVRDRGRDHPERTITSRAVQ